MADDRVLPYRGPDHGPSLTPSPIISQGGPDPAPDPSSSPNSRPIPDIICITDLCAVALPLVVALIIPKALLVTVTPPIVSPTPSRGPNHTQSPTTGSRSPSRGDLAASSP